PPGRRLLPFDRARPVADLRARRHRQSRARWLLRDRRLSRGPVIPVNQNSWGVWVIANINVGVLYLFAISSLGVYGVIMGGWASNSKYAFLGSLRSAAQMVSYEVSIGFVIITVLLCAGSLNMTDIVNAQRTGIGTRLGLPNSAL